MKKINQKLVYIDFQHRDWRLNYFNPYHIIRELIESSKIRFYIYTTPDYLHLIMGVPNHRIEVCDDQADIVINELTNEGWMCANPIPKNYKNEI